MIRMNRVKGAANVIAYQLLEQYFYEQPNQDALCPRCGKLMLGPTSRQALSRWVGCYICPHCGAHEALEDAGFVEDMPLSEWEYIKDYRYGFRDRWE